MKIFILYIFLIVFSIKLSASPKRWVYPTECRVNSNHYKSEYIHSVIYLFFNGSEAYNRMIRTIDFFFVKIGNVYGYLVNEFAYNKFLENHYLSPGDIILQVDDCLVAREEKAYTIGSFLCLPVFMGNICKHEFLIVSRPEEQLGKIKKVTIVRNGIEMVIDVEDFLKNYKIKIPYNDPFQGVFSFVNYKYDIRDYYYILKYLDQNYLYLPKFDELGLLSHTAFQKKEYINLWNTKYSFQYIKRKKIIKQAVELKYISLQEVDEIKLNHGLKQRARSFEELSRELIEHIHPNGNILPTVEDLIEFDHNVYSNQDNKKLTIRVPILEDIKIKIEDFSNVSFKSKSRSYTLDEMQEMYFRGELPRNNPNSVYIPKARLWDRVKYLFGFWSKEKRESK